MIGYTYTMYLNFLLGFLVTRLNCLEMNFPVQNNRPVIGILSQDYYGNFKDYGDQSSYIAASYVKYIESAGGRVVPILVSQDGDYYRQLFRNINGLLLPGGGQFLNNSTYAEAGKIMYDLAVTANLEHDYFPIWGTCLGFELMSILAANGTSPLVRCRGWDVDGPINFLEEYEDLKNSSRMFKDLSFDLYQIMRTEKVAINYHRKCITTQTSKLFV
ncbi:Gamma-glutamyl hydrolase [Halotydeus destructor]|nr:Gamma-glutamyl hydrolase [Halotydeus destructor]